jgi:hypothetical protein
MGNAIRYHFVIEITFNMKYIAIEDLVHKKMMIILQL